MKTHGWPIQSEVDAAAKSIRRSGAKPSFFDQAADWFAQTGKPLPWANTPDITYHLIEIGALASYRDARFKGFALSQDQNRIALSQPMTHEEFDHHCAVMAKLRGVDVFEVRIREAEALGL